MRFKEGDRVTTGRGSNGNSGVVRATFRDEPCTGEPQEVVVIRMDEGYLLTLSPGEIEREPKRLYIESTICTGKSGDVPRVLVGPDGMIKDIAEFANQYFGGEYDPGRGDEWQVNLTIELVRGD